MTDFGDELHRLLAQREISLREAARQVRCSAGYLSNVANGHKPLTPSLAARLDSVFGTGDTFTTHALHGELGHPEASGATTDSRPPRDRLGTDVARPPGHSNRNMRPEVLPAWSPTIAEARRDAAWLWSCELNERGTTAGSANLVASAVLRWLTAPPDRTAERAAGQAEISPHDVQRVRAVRARLKDLDNAHGGGVAFPMAVTYLRGEITELMRGSCDEDTGVALLEALAEIELDTGWFAYDAGDHRLARWYLLHALRLSHAARSRLLGARIVCALSHQALHVGQVTLSVDLARSARAGAGAGAPPRMASMLAAMEAMAHAGARAAAACSQALGDAEQALGRAGPDDDDPLWLDFDEGGLLGHRARASRDLAAVALAKPEHARRYAIGSVELCWAGHGRTRAQRNAILATTSMQAGDIGHAAAVGERIVADGWHLRSRHVEGDIASLLASIEPARSRAASGFIEQAREFLGSRAPARPAT